LRYPKTAVYNNWTMFLKAMESDAATGTHNEWRSEGRKSASPLIGYWLSAIADLPVHATASLTPNRAPDNEIA
jgi:hypothetical protein